MKYYAEMTDLFGGEFNYSWNRQGCDEDKIIAYYLGLLSADIQENKE